MNKLNKKSFRFRYKNKDQFINGLKSLKEIDALGTEICVGTYLPDSLKVENVLNEKYDVYVEKLEYSEDVCEISIAFDDNAGRNERFGDLYGKNHIMVSLTTVYDVSQGDIPKRTVPYSKIIKETLKLME